MIYIGSDHGGFELKNQLFKYINGELGVEIKDMGCFSSNSVDYPDIAKSVCDEVINSNGIGILLCGTGIGISMAANKIKNIRCALCSNEYSAKMAKKHNNANVLALGARVIGIGLAKSIIETFLNTEFEGGRHRRRTDKIDGLLNS
jgi:ribose 5-phosphate isomerase B